MVQARLNLRSILLQACSIKWTSFGRHTNTYAHCSILEVLLNYDKKAAESQLGFGFFCKHTAGKIEEMDISADPVLNTGLGTRSGRTKTSKIVELQGRIHSDLFNQEKRGLNGVDLTVKPRHKPEFCLVSADTAPLHKMTIVDTILYVKKIELTPSVFSATNTVLNDKMHSTPLQELLLKYLQCQADNKVNT